MRRRLRRNIPVFGSSSRWFAFALLPLLVTTVGIYEAHTSAIEAAILSAISSRLSYQLGAGPSPEIVFPEVGPFNESRGYTELPAIEHRLADAGFHIVAQSVLSPELQRFTEWGITPPYDEAAVAGLKLRDQNGTILFDAARGQHVFESYEDIPPLVIQALLLVENRELADSDVPTRNPVIDWTRSAKAGLLYVGHRIGLPIELEGGSTLATQMEKFRYAEGGRTKSVGDKLRQMLSASLRVYRSGTDTRRRRHEIVLDYLNSVPLAAANGYGAVYGLGNGLHAWFGIDLHHAQQILKASPGEQTKSHAFKHVLALICAARAPTFYLKNNPSALEERVGFFLRQMESRGMISAAFARDVLSERIEVLRRAPAPQEIPYIKRKAANAIRADLLTAVGVKNLYALDRLDLEAHTTLNAGLQNEVLRLFENLKDPAFAASHGLRQRHLLLHGDPARITFSFTLFERTNSGNVLRVQADTLNQPFDLNNGMKLELGSTAKLRTLAHYLELMASLYRDLNGHEKSSVLESAEAARDPITQWAIRTMNAEPAIDLETFLNKSLDRRYSGNPGEVFFTGGGQHVFGNFDSSEDGQMYTLRSGLQHSVNLVYIRLMRDLVRFHQARLPYDMNSVLDDHANSDRKRMLKEIADDESRYFLLRAYRRYRGATPDEIVQRLLGSRLSTRRLAMLFLAWNRDADADGLAEWLAHHNDPVSREEARRLRKSYPPHLNISDYGYLLDLHPLDVWCAGRIAAKPAISWNELLKTSSDVREIAFRWLFQERNSRAQNLRLRIRFEQDAFARMLPYWQRLGFPFDHLVPSLATAIGSSADRPAALAEVMGIILNDGIRFPARRIEKLRFAGGTPYETVFEHNPPEAERVMEPAVARALREVLAAVVENGTAIRLAGAIDADGEPIVIGGKTGSGDNRKSSRVISRTGTFAFYIGDRYFGAVTAYVAGAKAADYRFTSALPVTALKLLAPSISRYLSDGE